MAAAGVNGGAMIGMAVKDRLEAGARGRGELRSPVPVGFGLAGYRSILPMGGGWQSRRESESARADLSLEAYMLGELAPPFGAAGAGGACADARSPRHGFHRDRRRRHHAGASSATPPS